MLKATTEQKKHIAESFGYSLSDFENGGVFVDAFISFDEMAAIVDYLRTSDTKKELFDECWKAYRRKGVKKKALEYWKKLSDNEKDTVMPHIKAYVQVNDIQYQKDFERYLRDKVFENVVYNNNQVVYDPTMGVGGDVYTPMCGGALFYNDYYKCYLYTGFWDGHIADGYDDDKRPDGAEVTLNNGRGTVVWSRESKTWNKK